jgi:TolB protein
MNRLKCHRKTLAPLLVGIGLVVLLGGCQRPGTPAPVSPLPVVSPPSSPLGTPAARPTAEIGGRVVFHRQEEGGRFNIYILDLKTGELTQLTEGTGNNYDPVWSPDGTRIAFMSDREQRPPYSTLWVMNADGTEQRPLLASTRYLELGPTWSPDGTRIAFQSDRDGNADIFIFDLRSESLTNLTQHPNVDANPAWSPDGAQIAFASDRASNPEIWVISADGSGLRQITTSPTLGDWRPAWSPDGRSLIFESFPTVAPRDFYTQALDETEAHKIETFSVWNMWPAWITDDLILYAASEEYDEDTHTGSPANLYLQNLKTGEVKQLTSGTGNDGRPSWSP